MGDGSMWGTLLVNATLFEMLVMMTLANLAVAMPIRIIRSL